MGRVIGLSRNAKPEGLLRTIKNKPQPSKKLPPADDDPPLASSDDDESVAISPSHDASQTSRSSQRPGSRKETCSSLSDTSCDEKAVRGSITQTNFTKASKEPSQQRVRGKRKENIESLDPGAEESDNGQTFCNKRRRNTSNPPPSRGPAQRSSEANPSSSGDHLKNRQGFVKSKSSRLTYGLGVKAKSKEQAENKVAAANQLASETSPSSTRAIADTPLSAPDLLESPKRSKARLQLPEKEPPPSPRKRRQTLWTKFPGADKLFGNESDGSHASTSAESRRANKTEWSKKGRGNQQLPERSPTPTGHVLKMPAQVSDFERGANGSNRKSEKVPPDLASETEKSNGSLSDLEVISSDAEAGTASTVCPWCGQPVDKSLMDDFSRGKRMNVRLQARFCRQHKKQTAMETWQAKSYPEVDWEGLNSRFAAHRGFLLGIVNGKDSHFRTILAQKIASGHARSIKKEGNMNPGYYGPRGFDLMCDYLVDVFGELLKGKAVDDRVIAGRGSAAFIQTVLVPELAVQLIKDDMRVSVEEARRIMEESKALGEMIHEGT